MFASNFWPQSILPEALMYAGTPGLRLSDRTCQISGKSTTCFRIPPIYPDSRPLCLMKMDNEEVEDVQPDSHEQIVQQLRSSSTNAQISAARGIHTRLESEGMSRCVLPLKVY